MFSKGMVPLPVPNYRRTRRNVAIYGRGLTPNISVRNTNEGCGKAKMNNKEKVKLKVRL